MCRHGDIHYERELAVARMITSVILDMMTIHQFNLHPEPFTAIASGDKTIESRLYDEKRRKIQLGDQIMFINRANPDQTVTAIVVGLLRYATFHDLFSHNDPRKFGSESTAWLENQMNGFYQLDKQLQNSVVGIEFVLI